MTAQGRVFVFLQGPHGPFFDALARLLREAGAETLRVGFNAGDRAFWRFRAGYVPYRGTPADWPASCAALLDARQVTDLVLYGDTRPVHAAAIAAAQARNIAVHVFEEGYLRPYWITYERGGANGNSRVMQMPLAAMQAALGTAPDDLPAAPATWGDLWQHVFYGALYHFLVLFANRGYPGFRTHRDTSVAREFRLNAIRLATLPFRALERWYRTRRLLRSGHPFHVVLLQLAHDASFRDHGPFPGMEDFLDTVIRSFATGAPGHHRLAIKAHPLEDGRTPLRPLVRRLALRHGVAGRVHLLPGGKLAPVLDQARSAVTVNSTAGQQVLWRGLPLKCFGRAVYARPGLVSAQPLSAFFAEPDPPDLRSYRTMRRYLLETSQIPGGYYSARGRRKALRSVADALLSPLDRYETLTQPTAAPRQQLQAVT